MLLSLSTFSTVVQTTTLAVLAFRSSAFIFKEHTIAGRLAPIAWKVTTVDTAEGQSTRSFGQTLGPT
ncbi:MAG: hypothetical protein BJ554DRAFT_81 [Olpidium bornovanus]|uniref:Uncharacterized protein n=1 Tax=Olpidium bornovanus TaxID=278681 RepID=A0A8H7ZU15_9FUNG|nr:MAG: hypothetical protein BJ554DRAFT_81 [Olpidium bornovanus]